MKHEIIIAGFGGQGVLTAGLVLAYAAVDQGLNATWLPSYGPEMRGGTANCHVIISDEEIGSPIVSSPDILITFNKPSLDKFLPRLKPEGILIYDSSTIGRIADARAHGVPSISLAEKAGTNKAQNAVVLGKLMQRVAIFDSTALARAFAKALGDDKAAHACIAMDEGFRHGI